MNSSMKYDKRYTTEQEIFSDIEAQIRNAEKIKNKQRVYLNIPCSLDIETTSFTINDKKYATMYVCCININGVKKLCRTWYEVFGFLRKIENLLTDNQTIIIYIHNLSFEFQFMRHWLDIKEVFADDIRKPIYVRTNNIEYRCSYKLKGLSLADWGKQLGFLKLEETVDYNLKRHSKTPLTDDDILYVERDTDVVVKGIEQEIKYCGDITKIPYTKTGYVRKTCRDKCIKYNAMYRCLIQNMTLDIDEYKHLKNAFAGGHTHANSLYVGEVVQNVMSKDETSAYPFALCTEQFPMTKSVFMEKVSNEKAEMLMEKKCCVFCAVFKNIMVKVDYESIISESKCHILGEKIINNGRVWFAEELYIVLTEIDFKNISMFYSWEDIRFNNMYYYGKNYLPRDFVLSVLELYKDKTELKDVEGQEIYYLKSKEQVNSAYGMCVTSIIRDVISYTNDWVKSEPNELKDIQDYNNNRNRFLSYIWGLYTTAHARHNLYMAIDEVKDDYVYSDTDSVKYVNYKKHEKWFEEYNNNVIKRLHTISDIQNIDIEYFMPKTIEGVRKPLGVWETDAVYDNFKTLGAKRYVYDKNGKFGITIAGLNKKVGGVYIKENGGFDFFNDSMKIPATNTGKLTHTYIDEPFTVPLVDYFGNKMLVSERSAIHLENCSFDLSMSNTFKEFLKIMKGERAKNKYNESF